MNRLDPAAPAAEPELLASRCVVCSSAYYPQTDVCPSCLSRDLVAEALSDGTAYAFSTVSNMPPGFESPATIGYVDYPAGVRVFGYMSDRHGTIEPGTPVIGEPAIVGASPSGVEVPGVVFARDAARLANDGALR